jgi:hypothetical protein
MEPAQIPLDVTWLAFTLPEIPTPPIINPKLKLDVVVHACDPSYSGGRERKISSLKPAQAR